MRAAFISLTIIMFSLMPGCASVPGPVDSALSVQVQEQIRTLLASPQHDKRVTVAGSPLVASDIVTRLYAGRDYQALWALNGRARAHARTLERELDQIDSHGLPTTLFHLAALQEIPTTEQAGPDLTRRVRLDSATARQPRAIAERDLLLTDAFITYAALMTGVPVGELAPAHRWQRHKKDPDQLISLLEEGLKKRRFERFLRQLQPSDPEYRQLQDALVTYQEIGANGAWPQIPAGPRLERSLVADRVALLRTRLFIAGDLADDNGSTLFDKELEEAVQSFQRRHGLVDDGVVSKKTLAALNISATERAQQIALNLERRRWSEQLPKKYIRVNIPDYRLEAFQDDERVLTMNVVVGRSHEDWRTPQISSDITHMILNPTWNVPNSIFKKELLKKIQEDPEYLEKENMQVVRTYGARETIDPLTIDWSQIDPDAEEVRIIQRAGAGNALGLIKFMFPNPYAIYLHDTLSKRLFQRPERAFSHGCVRVARPMEMALYLLEEQDNWDQDRLTSELSRKKSRDVRLQGLWRLLATRDRLPLSRIVVRQESA